MTGAASENAGWPEAIAEVTECRYDVRAGRALAFGLTTKKHFRITYNYRVGDGLHVGQCYAEKAMPQGTLFPIRYNPDLPQEHNSLQPGTTAKVPLIAIGLAGSIVLAMLWLLFLHGCT